jgi:uncharacterized protein YjiS (DUF1127 family)
MRQTQSLHLQSLHLLGDSAPAEQFGRIARSIPAPHRLPTAATESANAASLRLHSEGDADPGPNADLAALDSTVLQTAARTHPSQSIGEVLISLLRVAVVLVRGWSERFRRHIDAQAIHRELAGLDSRTLRDIGIHHRNELPFVARRLAHGEDPREFNGQR